MAKQFTIKGIIKFIDDNASKTVKKVDDRIAMLKKNTDRINKGGRQLGGAMLTIGAGGAVAGVGIGKAIQASANFEQQLARVGALAQASEAELALMTNTAKRLGGTTEFTAVQAGQGLEFLALAGIKAKDAVDVLPTILDTAAAGALDLGRASDIVTDSMSALGAAFSDDFNTPAERAVRMADLMSFAQANANTNIEQLGEAIKFGGGALAGVGLPMEQIIASMGKLADAGLKGSLGGTALMNMFNKLLKPTDEIKEGMKLLGVDMENLPLQDMPKLVSTLSGALEKIKDPTLRSRIAMETFGARGIRAFNALQEAGSDSIAKLTKGLEGSEGTAKEVADKQRATFQGMQKSFASASERIFIEIGDFFTKSEDRVLDAFGGVIKVMQDFGAALGFVNMSLTDQKKAMKNLSPGAKRLIDFAQGLKDGMEEAFDIAKETFFAIKEGLKGFIPEGENGTRMLGKMVAKFAILSAALAPVLIGVVGLGFAFSQLTGFITGPFNILRGGIPILWSLGKTILPIVIKGMGLLWSVGVKALLGVGKAMLWLLANPVGLTIVGIVALVAAGWWLWKNWDDVWGGLKRLVSGAIDGMIGTFKFFIDWIKNASIGEIIMKTILAPLRLALTPIMELISFIANSKLAKKFIGAEAAKSIKTFADAVSLIPTNEELQAKAVVQPASASATSAAQDINQTSAEQMGRTIQPPSAEVTTGPINFTPPQLDFTIENITQLDGKELSRSQSKIATENSERAGMTAKNPKNRSLSRNGQFQPGFAR